MELMQGSYVWLLVDKYLTGGQVSLCFCMVHALLSQVSMKMSASHHTRACGNSIQDVQAH